MEYTKITYRDIAKNMFCKALPVTGDAYTELVDTITETIKNLPVEARIALKTAYVFAKKVPREDREDMFQELALAVLTVDTKQERFAYAIARQDWRDWWKRYNTRQHYCGGSLNECITDSDGEEREQIQLIAGAVEFERKMDGKLDAERIWNTIPDNVKPVINKRLLGVALDAAERQRLSRFVRAQGSRILLATM